jgi:hypothetical protein
MGYLSLTVLLLSAVVDAENDEELGQMTPCEGFPGTGTPTQLSEHGHSDTD